MDKEFKQLGVINIQEYLHKKKLHLLTETLEVYKTDSDRVNKILVQLEFIDEMLEELKG